MLAAALWKWRPPLAGIERLAWVGAVSYGIYIFQRPAEWTVLLKLPLPEGTVGSFGLRVALVCGLTLALAYAGEHGLQPRLTRWARKWF